MGADFLDIQYQGKIFTNRIFNPLGQTKKSKKIHPLPSIKRDFDAIWHVIVKEGN